MQRCHLLSIKQKRGILLIFFASLPPFLFSYSSLLFNSESVKASIVTPGFKRIYSETRKKKSEEKSAQFVDTLILTNCERERERERRQGSRQAHAQILFHPVNEDRAKGGRCSSVIHLTLSYTHTHTHTHTHSLSRTLLLPVTPASRERDVLSFRRVWTTT